LSKAGHPPVVETLYGAVQGIPGRNGGWHFAGIPFASPPVGELRFRPPLPPRPWSELRHAGTPGPICSQTLTMLERLQGLNESHASEDCLYLNVWTADLNASKPVMVWFHGGGFVNGAGSFLWYDGSRLATHYDCVVVTFNYRLGVFGFADLSQLGCDRLADAVNLGLRDQLAALEWVRDNIAAFGGDPNRVCAFGESAGAMSIGALLAMPAARDLFHAAILESGAASNVTDQAQAAAVAEALLKQLELDPDEASKLAILPTETLLKAQAALISEHEIGMPFLPVIDGATLIRHPLEAVRLGLCPNVALVVGYNAEELKLFAALNPPLRNIDIQDLKERTSRLAGERAREILATYRATRPQASPGDLWEAIFGDYLFRVPALRLAEAARRGGLSCWLYKFAFRSTAFGGRFGSCHAMEIPFVFDNLTLPGVDAFTGNVPGRERLAAIMASSWTQLGRSRSPRSATLEDWPLYELDVRPTMVFDLDSRLVYDPESEERQAWGELDPDPSLLGGT